MRTCCKKKGFTLLETITVVAVIAVLISAVLGMGRYLKQQADERLAQSTMAVMVTAVEQYYEFTGQFPPQVATDQDLAQLLGFDVAGLPVGHQPEFASSEALYYMLDNCVRSKGIIDSLGGGAITNKSATGEPLAVAGIDLVRVVDPWGNALIYTYAPGDAFPELRFAGRDGVMGTEDDVTSI